MYLVAAIVHENSTRRCRRKTHDKLNLDFDFDILVLDFSTDLISVVLHFLSCLPPSSDTRDCKLSVEGTAQLPKPIKNKKICKLQMVFFFFFERRSFNFFKCKYQIVRRNLAIKNTSSKENHVFDNV